MHGRAQLTVALENDTQGSIVFEAPGESVVGFEHVAKSAADKKKQSAALDLLRNRPSELFVFDPKAKCVIKTTKVEVDQEDHHDDEGDHHAKEPSGGEHSEIEAEYTLTCQMKITGSELGVQLGKHYPNVKDLDAQVLVSKGQTSTKLKGGVGKLTL